MSHDSVKNINDSKKTVSYLISAPKLYKSASKVNALIVVIILVLLYMGFMLVVSASSVRSLQDTGNAWTESRRHLIYIIIGLITLFITSRISIDKYVKFSSIIYLAVLAMQLLVYVPGIGRTVGGNRNWIRIASFSGQPSEFLKLALIIWCAGFIFRYRDVLANNPRTFWFFLFGIFIAPVLVVLGGDVGTAIIMAGIILSVLFFSAVKLRYVFLVISLFGLALLAAILLKGNRLARTSTFFQECKDPIDLCQQPMHGEWALATGGVDGLGPGNSVAKWLWLPAAENDYIFAILGEEYGFVIAIVVILAFVLLTIMMSYIIVKKHDIVVSVIVGSVMIWVIGQALINISVVVGLLPVFGVPLPLLSSGGSSLIAILAAFGVCISANRGYKNSSHISSFDYKFKSETVYNEKSYMRKEKVRVYNTEGKEDSNSGASNRWNKTRVGDYSPFDED